MVSVLATGPKGCVFEPGQDDVFFRAIKIRSTPYFGWEIKPEVPCRKILRHVKNSRSPTGIDTLNSHFFRPSPTAPEASLVTARALWLSS
jgi:hypothetical protein